ncbi:hypothetical protein [Halosolutus halophilus]|uniref:hypothetical protein n=1 Tax=Halosolutus halophilus TaxID=1552990 RepID=UPI002A5A6D2D|nr:hypothetical protein [Halosolutus halophilus]
MEGRLEARSTLFQRNAYADAPHPDSVHFPKPVGPAEFIDIGHSLDQRWLSVVRLCPSCEPRGQQTRERFTDAALQ